MLYRDMFSGYSHQIHLLMPLGLLARNTLPVYLTLGDKA